MATVGVTKVQFFDLINTLQPGGTHGWFQRWPVRESSRHVSAATAWADHSVLTVDQITTHKTSSSEYELRWRVRNIGSQDEFFYTLVIARIME